MSTFDDTECYYERHNLEEAIDTRAEVIYHTLLMEKARRSRDIYNHDPYDDLHMGLFKIPPLVSELTGPRFTAQNSSDGDLLVPGALSYDPWMGDSPEYRGMPVSLNDYAMLVATREINSEYDDPGSDTIEDPAANNTAYEQTPGVTFPCIVNGCLSKFATHIDRLYHMDLHFEPRYHCPGPCKQLFHHPMLLRTHCAQSPACTKYWHPQANYAIFQPGWKFCPLRCLKRPAQDDPMFRERVWDKVE